MTSILLATDEGLLRLDGSGATHDAELVGAEVCALATDGSELVVAVAGRGVLRHRASGWEPLGLDDTTVWTVTLAPGGIVYAGTEPAAVLRLGVGPPAVLDALAKVEGYDGWHSPWGPADLSGIVVDGDRIVVGVEVGGVAVSHDAGATWEARNDGLYEDVHALAARGPLLLATTGMGLHRSIDEGRHWTWEAAGIDRGYTQGLALAGDHVVVAAASGPPPMWERDGAEAALFRAELHDGALQFTCVHDGLAGNVERLGIAARDALVVAGSDAGELLVSDDAGAHFRVLRADLPPIAAVALTD